MRPIPYVVAASIVAATTMPASALDILLTNDDGLTSNVMALYDALTDAGHDVIVSVPCTGQSGQGAALSFLRPVTPLAEACLNNAGQTGDPGAGPVTKVQDGYDFADFSYVMGTPIMATAYGLDVVAAERWGHAPDLVLSGPNEGQNVGNIVNSSGTVANAQFAASRGLSAMALSAGANTVGEMDEAGNFLPNPLSEVVADLSIALVNHFAAAAGDGQILPAGVALNVNFPDEVTAETPFSFSIFGSYNVYTPRFVENLSEDPAAQSFGLGGVAFPGLSIGFLAAEPSADQLGDEAVVMQQAVAVTAMQVGFEAGPETQAWLQEALGGLND